MQMSGLSTQILPANFTSGMVQAAHSDARNWVPASERAHPGMGFRMYADSSDIDAVKRGSRLIVFRRTGDYDSFNVEDVTGLVLPAIVKAQEDARLAALQPEVRILSGSINQLFSANDWLIWAGRHGLNIVRLDDSDMTAIRSGKRPVLVIGNQFTGYHLEDAVGPNTPINPNLTADQNNAIINDIAARARSSGGLSSIVSGVVQNVVQSVSAVASKPIDIISGKETLSISSLASMATAPLGLATTAGAGGAEVTQKVGNAIGAAAVVGTAAYALAGGFATPAATTAPTAAAAAPTVAAPVTEAATAAAIPSSITTGALSTASTGGMLSTLAAGVKTAAGAALAVQQIEASKAVGVTPTAPVVAPKPTAPAAAPLTNQQLMTMLQSPVVLAALAAAVFLL